MSEGGYNMKLVRTENQLNPNRYWTLPVKNYVFHPKAVALFDQNGYDLTEVEKEYAKANGYSPKEHRHLHTCKAKWFVDEEISYVAAIGEFNSGRLTESDSKITVSPR